jgi:protein ImuB
MTLAQSRAILPKIFARGRDRESERAAQETLLEVAESFSPRVEDAQEGVVYLDMTGLPFLSERERQISGRQSPPHPDPLPEGEGEEGRAIANHSLHPELLFAQELIAAAGRAGLPARAGIASSRLAARVAAGLPESPRVVPPGGEAEFLAPLPLARLAPEMEIAETLDRWGIHSVGDFARLPEREVSSRLGELGRRLHATARGEDPSPLEPRLPPLHFSEGMDLDWSLVTLEPFLFLGHAALERLVRRLEAQALACSRLEVLLKLDPDGHDARAIALPAPTRETKTLLTLVRLELEARPPGAAVTGFVFTAHPDRPRRAQLSLFGPAELSPDRLATAIARLAALLGANRVGSPRAVDGHRPERCAVVAYAPPPSPALERKIGEGRGLLSVRVLRPPVELEVKCSAALLPLPPGAGEREGWLSAAAVAARPAAERFKTGAGEARGSPPLPPGEGRGEGGTGATLSLRPISVKSLPNTDGGLEIQGAVRIAAGPWFMEEGWWTDAPATREYWDVELSEGGLYRIFRDRDCGSWFADGVYD